MIVVVLVVVRVYPRGGVVVVLVRVFVVLEVVSEVVRVNWRGREGREEI